ncbi:MAG: hypothetical protein U1F52_18500 [Burkholderiales bacterium]
MILGLKLLLVPTLIGGITLSGRRWGPAVAGWLSAFPVVSGPILFFVAVEQGPAFAAAATEGTFSAMPANLAFGIGYAWAATKHSWPVSLGVAFFVYLLAAAAMVWTAPSLPWSALMVLAALLIAPRLYPAVPSTVPKIVVASTGSDLPLRMATGAVLVLLVTHFAATLGPRASGVAAMFPVMASVLVVFSHRHAGAAFAIRLLKGMVLGFYSFGTFCVVLAVLLPVCRVGPAFAGSLGAAAFVLAASKVRLGRGRRVVSESRHRAD